MRRFRCLIESWWLYSSPSSPHSAYCRSELGQLSPWEGFVLSFLSTTLVFINKSFGFFMLLIACIFPAFVKRNKMASICIIWILSFLTSLLDLFTSSVASSVGTSFPKKCPVWMRSDQWRRLTKVAFNIVHVRSYTS